MDAKTPDALAKVSEGSRYRVIADDLTRAIGQGKFAVGQTVPTEAALCARYSVSRHTVREALRRLVDQGLIDRRRGSPSRVLATAPQVAYVHRVDSLPELFEYARNTKLCIADMKPVRINEEEAELIVAQAGSSWVRIRGIRRSMDGRDAICSTVVFVHSRFQSALHDVHQWSGPIYALLEERTGEVITEVLQEISAGPLPRKVAAGLSLRAGSPALRFLRRYLDASGGPMMTSVNWHAAAHFTYVVRLARDRY
ncbi:MAG: GntR family transcriptional regulator [Alphaproteobacteria bacterium]|nr:GntR family transcriptional regulator [Alphaproteobacteria bacterium]